MSEYIVTWENTAGSPASSNVQADSREAAIWRVALLMRSPHDAGYGYQVKFISCIPADPFDVTAEVDPGEHVDDLAVRIDCAIGDPEAEPEWATPPAS